MLTLGGYVENLFNFYVEYISNSQVEDVDHKFAELSKLHANNWLDDEPKVVQKKKVIKVRAY